MTAPLRRSGNGWQRLLAVSDLDVSPGRIACLVDESPLHDAVLIAGDTLDPALRLERADGLRAIMRLAPT